MWRTSARRNCSAAVDPSAEVWEASERVLEGVAGEVALAIERAGLEERARQAEVLGKAEELQRTLLHSVSHSLRTPLAAIVSALDPIADPDAVINQAAIAELARIARGRPIAWIGLSVTCLICPAWKPEHSGSGGSHMIFKISSAQRSVKSNTQMG